MKVALLKFLSKKITAFYLQSLIIFNTNVAAQEPPFCYIQQQLDEFQVTMSVTNPKKDQGRKKN